MTEINNQAYRKEPDRVRDINRLWMPVYPGLARQVADVCTADPQRILEIGCFSGGVGLELLKIFPKADLTIALDMPELAVSFNRDWNVCDAPRIKIVETPLKGLRLSGAGYDLVFCRGAFFFLDPEAVVVHEMFRVLAEGGVAFFGGGYGTYTSEKIIAGIADESRIKNDAIGRKIYTVSELRLLLQKNGLEEQTEIVEKGGLWVVSRKN